MPRPWPALLCVVALPLFAGCFSLDYEGPTTREIERTFATHRAAFDRLDAMLGEDPPCAGASGGRRYLSVGVDRVCDFWKRRWRWNQITPDLPRMVDATRGEMLGAVGLTEARYERYLDLLDATGAQRATQIGGGGPDPETELYLGGAGWVSSSYYVSVVRRTTPPDVIVDDVFAYVEREGYGVYQVYSVLGDGWYIEMDMVW